MHARSAVVDLYGDHLGAHGSWAPVAGVVALAGSCGVRPPATRQAVVRLVREGWLHSEERHGLRGYAVTPVASARLAGARERIYAPSPAPWDGTWHVVVLGEAGRATRERAAAALGYLGYGRLAPQTWVSPHRSPELADRLHGLGMEATSLVGGLDLVGAGSPAELCARVWDLDTLAEDYLALAATVPAETDLVDLADLSPEVAYPRRVALVHEWRKFLFVDPGLPVEVLPAGWPGQVVRERVLAAAAVLRPAADLFVADALAAAGAPPAAA